MDGITPVTSQSPPVSAPKPGFEAALAKARPTREATRLREACAEMESFLWSYVFRQMRASGTDSLFGNSPAMDSFRDMLDTEHARQLSNGGGLGLGTMLYAELSRRLGSGK